MKTINFEFSASKPASARYLQVQAEVRYWEDALVGGKEDTDGTLIPFRQEDLWCPVIDLIDGKFLGWPEGLTADIHYKVCDQGEYWLLNESKQRIAEYKSHYVPDDLLCVGDTGHGDYIILIVSEDGSIKGWREPEIDGNHWILL